MPTEPEASPHPEPRPGTVKTRNRILLAGLAALGIAAALLWTPDLDPAELERRYATGASRFVDLPGGARAHVRLEGPEDAPVLALVHGSNSSLHTWEPWVAELGDRYRILSMDLPGHGLTGPTPADDYSRHGMAAYLDELRATLDIERMAIAGSSMGGRSAWAYTLAHPERVTALILVDASGFLMEGHRITFAFRLAGTPVVSRFMDWFTPRAIIRRTILESYHDPSQVTEALVDRYDDLLRRPGNRRATRLRFGGQGDLDAARGAGLERIEVPTLVLWGEADRMVPVSAAEEFRRAIPGSEVVIYPQTGHLPMEEVPARSAADVAAFLERALEPPARWDHRSFFPAIRELDPAGLRALLGEPAAIQRDGDVETWALREPIRDRDDGRSLRPVLRIVAGRVETVSYLSPGDVEILVERMAEASAAPPP